jgi:hypothetical protein
MSEQPIEEVAEENVSVLRRTAFVALVLILTGVTILTVGTMLAFGFAAGLIALGLLTISGGVLLGITS